MGSADRGHQSCHGWRWGQQLQIKTKAESNRPELRGGAGRSQVTEELVPRAPDDPMAGCPMSMTGKVWIEEAQGAGVRLLPCLCIADLTLTGSVRLSAGEQAWPVQVCNCLGQRLTGGLCDSTKSLYISKK